jgi:hypothetical protein
MTDDTPVYSLLEALAMYGYLPFQLAEVRDVWLEKLREGLPCASLILSVVRWFPEIDDAFFELAQFRYPHQTSAVQLLHKRPV